MAKVLQANLEAALAENEDWEEESSSEEEGENKLQEIKIIGDAPTKKTKDLKSAKESSNNSKQVLSSVLYIGHLPVGFEESEIRGFFRQFGSVENVKVSRSKKTGRSKGYGFLKFTDPEVAKIATEAMNGYFLLEKRIICQIVPLEKIHSNLFPKKAFRMINFSSINKDQVNRKRSAEEWSKLTKQQAVRENKKRQKLKALGIDYDFPNCMATSHAQVDKKNSKKSSVVDEDGDINMTQDTKIRSGRKIKNKKTVKDGEEIPKEQDSSVTERNSSKKKIKEDGKNNSESKSVKKSSRSKVKENQTNSTSTKKKLVKQDASEERGDNNIEKTPLLAEKKKSTSTKKKKKRQDVVIEEQGNEKYKTPSKKKKGTKAVSSKKKKSA